MLVERIFPKETKRYTDAQKIFEKSGNFIEKFSIMRLFIIWSLTTCGTVLSAGLENRFVYWDWSGTTAGLVRLAIVSVVFFLILRPNKLWLLGSKRLANNELASHTLMASALIFFGGLGSGADFGRFILNSIPYIIGFLGAALVFQFPIKLDQSKGEWFVENWVHKYYYLGLSSLFFLIAILAGFYLDDPILSTVAMVNLPFSMVALIFPEHVRHLQRARFFPLFIFSLFLCVRAPWFLIPLIILFFFLRTVNYFRYGIAYPSFGVDFDESALYDDV
tara:strand:- start:55 stop:885 length:831 start_codon:yes stop_codon:yes gene_type:complete